MMHLEVAVAAPVTETLTYSFPEENITLQPGIRLLVPLGRRKVTGYLLAVNEASPTQYKIKPISEILDTEPLFPENSIPFFRWISWYYRYPIGEVIKQALPGGLTAQSGKKIILTKPGTVGINQFLGDLPAPPPKWLIQLLDKGSLSPAAVRKIKTYKWKKQLEKWQDEGFLTIEELITTGQTKAKTEICIRVNTPLTVTELSTLKPSEQKTFTLLNDLHHKISPFDVPRRELTKLYSGAAKAVKSLEKQGIISFTTRQIFRDPFGEEPPYFEKPIELTEEQKKVLSQLTPSLHKGNFSTFLLHGVTGSGKTEIYLRAAEEVCSRGRSVLVLVPEIALATQMEGHFFSRFGRENVAVLHSGLSTGERYDQWCEITQGKIKIVIGARSAIFAPLNDPGLIIVDEEHDGSYKQDDSLRYHARDLAVLRGSQQKSTVILGSATPSLTSFYHAAKGKYQLLSLHKRVADRPQPEVSVVDLKKIKPVAGKIPLFSPLLLEAIKNNLEQNNQSLIFLNRRGYANLLLCSDCGNPVQCRHCHVSLTLHKEQNALICHHCGHTEKSALLCPHCRSHHIKEIGFGTERIESELAQRFPTAAIARLDRDTARSRSKFLRTLKAVHNREIDILIGTQMITKGHHFPHVTLVGIIWADAGLGIPDFKAGERTFQLISQVTGRAGRGEKSGRVIIQTHQPDHYAITCARQHDYLTFYHKERQLRKMLGYPPYSRLVNIRFSGESAQEVEEAAQHTARQIGQRSLSSAVTVLGPVSAPLSKLRGKYRWQLLLKAHRYQDLHSVCDALTQTLPALIRSGKVKMSMDVDPENML